MNALLICAGFGVGATALLGGFLLGWRQRAYGRLVKYRPNQDFVVGFSPSGAEHIAVRCDANGFVMPELKPGAAGGMLELNFRASLAGAVCDPSVQIETRGFRDEQFLERGVCGVRFLNVSRLLAAGVATSKNVALLGRHLSWHSASARLHVCHEKLLPADRVLVIAPHPDDAEIAAFGLYADSRATVVTVSAGDGSDRYSGGAKGTVKLTRAAVAKIRVWDSITVPQLGDISREKAVNLCYPDGKLPEMHAQPAHDFRGDGDGALDFTELRRLNLSPLIREETKCSWDSLVRDLSHIMAETKPTIIATPHPCLDPHPDHMFTTIAVCAALRATERAEGRFYFYMNHNRRSELWPFGPAGCGVSMLPILPDDTIGCDGFYSHALSKERQTEKFLALEAMHDLRVLGQPEPLPSTAHLHRIRAEASAMLSGLGCGPD